MTDNLQYLQFAHSRAVIEEKKAYDALMNGLCAELERLEIAYDYVQLISNGDYFRQMYGRVMESYDKEESIVCPNCGEENKDGELCAECRQANAEHQHDCELEDKWITRQQVPVGKL